MKLLIITPYYYPALVYGGPAKSIALLAEGLAANQTDVTVYTTNANGNESLKVNTKLSYNLNGATVNYCKRIFTSISRYFFSSELWSLTEKTIGNFDVVYICGHWTFPFWIGARSAIKGNIPFIVSPRGSFMQWSINQGRVKKILYHNLIEKKLIDKAKFTHVTSSLEQQQLQNWPVFPNPILIPNGIKIKNHQGAPDYWRNKFGIPDNAPVCLYVGRLHKMKRVLRMIEAFNKVLEVIPNAHFWLAGGDEDNTLTVASNRIKELSIEQNVRMLGLLDSNLLEAAYANANLMILISHRENFGNVVIEALNHGIPVLLAKSVGIAQDVCSKGAGVIVDPDTNELERNWINLLGDLEKLKEMGEIGKSVVKTEYSIEKVAQQMQVVLEKAII